MSVGIFSGTLAVKENVGGNFQRHLAVTEKNVDGNFQRHFGCERKMSVEISSAGHFNCADKCWWSFQRRKVAVEISSDIFAVIENVGENF